MDAGAAVDSDIRLWYLIGVGPVFMYVVAVGSALALGRIGVDRRLGTFRVGFGLFIAVYLISVNVLRLAPGDPEALAAPTRSCSHARRGSEMTIRCSRQSTNR